MTHTKQPPEIPGRFTRVQGHGLMALFGCFVFVFLSGMSSASFGRRHIDTVSAVWSKYSMEPCQLHSRLGDQGSQFADEIQPSEDDVGRAITIRRFKLDDA